MRSMTGFGKAQRQAGDWEVSVDLKSVNHRFLDVASRLPRTLDYLEPPLREGVSLRLRRGHVDVYASLRRVSGDSRTVRVREDRLRSYIDACGQISRLTSLPLEQVVSAGLVPAEDLTETVDAEVDEAAVTALFRETLAEALDQLCAMREREGENLRRDLSAHLEEAAALRERILQRAPQVVTAYQQRLTERLAQLGVKDVDPARLCQEVALMADRCAIDEELARLDSHIGEMRRYLDAPDEIGKKMDFLIQEMNREANTIGSKANDADIAALVVLLKSEIEKLREQIQNVE